MDSVKRERIGWYFYDWANSVFSTTVVTLFLGPYLTTVAKAAANADGFVTIFGFPIYAGSVFPYAVAASVALQVVLLPYLGALADYTRMKKTLMGIFAYIGAFATMGLYFLEGEKFLLGVTLFIIANLSFGASIVMYNAFLNEIASAEERDSVSSRGWAFGYLGGGLLLAANLLFVMNADYFGIAEEYAVRICLASAGVWWGIFTIIPLVSLKVRNPNNYKRRGVNYFSVGFAQLISTFRDARNHPQALLFLAAYLFYNDGVQSVIALSAVFGQEELGLSMSTLATVILMVQFIAIFGTILFNRISKILGTKKTISLTLIIWLLIILYAFLFLKSVAGFYALGAGIAIVLGPAQALSRSMFSRLIPKRREAEYFSLYEVSEKGTSWMGPLVFGLALQFTGSYRIAILSLAIFFIIGILILLKVKEKAES